MRNAEREFWKSCDSPRPNPWRERVATRLAQRLEKPDDKGDDELAELIQSANDDVSDTRKELLLFASALVLVFVTNYSITARDLLAGSAVELPFIKLAVPLLAFFLWTPLALVAVHIAVLLRLARVDEKLDATREAIQALQGEDERDRALLGVVSNFLAQLKVIEPEAGRHLLLWLVYVSVAFLAPVFALLAITVRALPLHDVWLTFVQNFLLAADVGVAAYLFFGHGKNWAFWPFLGVVVVANFVLCVPDSGFDRIGQYRFWSKEIVSTTLGPPRRAFWPTALLFESELDNVTRRRGLLGLSRDIVLVDDKPPVAADAARPPMNLRGRDLGYAIFDRSDLSGADLTAADLFGVSLVSTDLKRTQFGCAPKGQAPWGGEYGWGQYLYDVPLRAWFDELWKWFDVERRKTESERSEEESERSEASRKGNCTNFPKAYFEGADFRGGKFRWLGYQIPSLAGSHFPNARFDGVDLRGADLSRTDLRRASFAGAYLDNAQFVGARLDGADLTGVRAWGTDFSFSSMKRAHLDGADFNNGARFLAADMRGVSLFRTRLSGAHLGGALLRRAQVWETEPPRKEALAWTDLDGLVVKPFDSALVQRLQRVIDDNPNLTAAAVDADAPVEPWDQGLEQLRDAAKSQTRVFETQPAWEAAMQFLVAKKDDIYTYSYNEYAHSYKEVTAKYACLVALT